MSSETNQTSPHPNHHGSHKKNPRWRPFSGYLEQRTFSYKVVVVVTFIIMTLVMMQGMVSTQLFWKVGDIATRTITADRSFIYEDESATEEKQQEVLDSFEDVYEINLEQFNNLTLVSLDRAFDRLQEILVVNDEVRAAGAQDENYEKRHKELNDLLGSEVDDESWATLSSYTAEHVELLHQQTVAIASNIMGKGVKEADLAAAKQTLLEEVENSRAFSTLDRKIVRDILNDTEFYATSVINQKDSEAKRRELVESVEPVVNTVQKDEVIVNKGDTISEDDYAAIQALSNSNDRSPYKIILGVILSMVLVIAAVSKFSEWRARKKPDINWERNASVMLVVMAGIMILFPIISAIQIGPVHSADELINFMIPLPAAAIMVAILLDNEEGIFVTLVMGVVVALYTNDVYVGFASVAGSLMALGQVKVLHRRTDLTMSAVYSIGAMAVVVLIYYLITGLELSDLVTLLLFCVGNGFLTLVLTIGLLPYIESAFNITTSLTLMELCDPNTPLQRALMQKAAGTYQHSLMVANLAEAAALRVGADAQLVRTAAYYHDIGKIKRPEFFSENQMRDFNPHDKISANLSYLIITTHVKDGVALAKEARLPKSIIDIISQHHGNTVVGYFYHKAKKQDPDVRADDFRYPQKRPQSREAAILMIADTVEAAVRSNINHLNHGQVSSFIRTLINDKMNDKQFIECNLTYRDINEITDELVRMINSMYHKRVAYPDKKSLLK